MSEKQRSKPKSKIGFKSILAIIVVLGAILAGVGVYEAINYEESVLQIYANQQDSYVQLVLDQINLQPDRSDEEIIQGILGSLDKSDNKYWTMSKEQTLLFVKDVTETDRYKGFTTPSLYQSDSASKFLDKLELNKVVHEVIKMDDDRYVASGVIFEYNGAQYRICLLTNESFIMDDNAFLAAKISLYIYIVVLLMVLLVTSMVLTNLSTRRDEKIAVLQKRIEEMNIKTEELEEEILFMDRFHTRLSLFEESTIGTFIQKLEARGVVPAVLMHISFSGKKSMNAFLEKAQLLLDEKVLRFMKGKNGLILLFVQYRLDEARRAMRQMQDESFKVLAEVGCEQDAAKLAECYQELLQASERKRG